MIDDTSYCCNAPFEDHPTMVGEYPFSARVSREWRCAECGWTFGEPHPTYAPRQMQDDGEMIYRPEYGSECPECGGSHTADITKIGDLHGRALCGDCNASWRFVCTTDGSGRDGWIDGCTTGGNA